jgi:hypothetical protein
MGFPDDVFEAVITAKRSESSVKCDPDLEAVAWKAVTLRLSDIIRT